MMLRPPRVTMTLLAALAVTAVVVLGVVGLRLTAGRNQAGSAAFAGVDWSKAADAGGCGSLGVQVVDTATSDLTGDGRPEAVVVARCHTGAGVPPSTVSVYAGDSPPERPRLLATLVDLGDDLVVDAVTVTDGAVVARAFGFAQPDVPRCCPDRQLDLRWRWDGTRFAKEGAG